MDDTRPRDECDIVYASTPIPLTIAGENETLFSTIIAFTIAATDASNTNDTSGRPEQTERIETPTTPDRETIPARRN